MQTESSHDAHRQSDDPGKTWRALGVGAIVAAVVLLVRNVVSVLRVPGWENRFVELLVSTDIELGAGGLIPEPLAIFLVWGPIPLVALGLVLIGIGALRRRAARR